MPSIYCSQIAVILSNFSSSSCYCNWWVDHTSQIMKCIQVLQIQLITLAYQNFWELSNWNLLNTNFNLITHFFKVSSLPPLTVLSRRFGKTLLKWCIAFLISYIFNNPNFCSKETIKYGKRFSSLLFARATGTSLFVSSIHAEGTVLFDGPATSGKVLPSFESTRLKY